MNRWTVDSVAAKLAEAVVVVGRRLPPVCVRGHFNAWRDIGKRFGCDRTTAWRRWQQALQQVVDTLNGVRPGV